jgi:hypothetical protein
MSGCGCRANSVATKHSPPLPQSTIPRHHYVNTSRQVKPVKATSSLTARAAFHFDRMNVGSGSRLSRGQRQAGYRTSASRFSQSADSFCSNVEGFCGYEGGSGRIGEEFGQNLYSFWREGYGFGQDAAGFWENLDRSRAKEEAIGENWQPAGRTGQLFAKNLPEIGRKLPLLGQMLPRFRKTGTAFGASKGRRDGDRRGLTEVKRSIPG